MGFSNSNPRRFVDGAEEHIFRGKLGPEDLGRVIVLQDGGHVQEVELLLLAISGENKVLRFCFYNCRACFMFWILLYGGIYYLRTRDEVERQRLAR